MSKIVTVDIQKIEEEITSHEAELGRLREFLGKIRKFEVGNSAATKRKVGRPRRDEPRDVLAEFIDRQPGDFSNVDLKHALNGQKYPKYKFRAAVKQLIEEGKLVELKKPAGVRPGLYRRNGVAATV